MPALGLLVLRLALAVVLVAHGAHDVFGAFDGPGVGPGGLAQTGTRFEAVGLSPGFPVALLSGLTRLAGGLLICVGWLTRWAAVAVAATLTLTAWKANLRWGFFLNWVLDPTWGHGTEYAFILVAALVTLFFTGGGTWSLDGQREKSAAARAAGRARLRGK